MTKVIGEPLWNVCRPERVQSPSSTRCQPCWNLEPGDHNQEAITACRWSKSERPRLARRSKGFGNRFENTLLDIVSSDFESTYEALTEKPRLNRLIARTCQL